MTKELGIDNFTHIDDVYNKVYRFPLLNRCQPELVEGGLRRSQTAYFFVVLRQAQNDKEVGNDHLSRIKKKVFMEEISFHIRRCRPEIIEGGF